MNPALALEGISAVGSLIDGLVPDSLNLDFSKEEGVDKSDHSTGSRNSESHSNSGISGNGDNRENDNSLGDYRGNDQSGNTGSIVNGDVINNGIQAGPASVVISGNEMGDGNTLNVNSGNSVSASSPWGQLDSASNMPAQIMEGQQSFELEA